MKNSTLLLNLSALNSAYSKISFKLIFIGTIFLSITAWAQPLTLVQNIPTAVCPGQKLDIKFIQNATLNSGNVYSVQLSDAFGSFSSPTTIGTLTGITPAKIEATIPQVIPLGVNYRIRIISSIPFMASDNNGKGITIGGGDCCRSAIQWQLSLGSPSAEGAYKTIQTSDGGYLTLGWITGNGGDVTGFKGGTYDTWVVRLDAHRNVIWKKVYGGSGAFDFFYSVVEVSDGYVFAGSSSSSSGDVVNNKGDYDGWIVKTDFSGNIIWKQSLGSSGYDELFEIVAVSDGYVVTGVCSANDGDVSGLKGQSDVWAVKLNLTGSVIWKYCFGGSAIDRGRSISKTLDNGFYIVGTTSSINGDVNGLKGNSDVWGIKLNENGTLIWNKCIGGSGVDEAGNVVTSPDGSMIISGSSNSNDGDIVGLNNGGFDVILAKLEATQGNLVWRTMIGGAGDEDKVNGLVITPDQGVLLGARTASSDAKIVNPKGSTDIWLFKYSQFGIGQWQRTLGGSNGEQLYSLTLTADGGYLVGGYSFSSDKNVGYNQGDADYWIMKLAQDGLYITASTHTVCAGGSATLTLNGCQGSISWGNNKNNSTATTASITVVPTTTTVYSAVCTVNGCSAYSHFTLQTASSMPFKGNDYSFGGTGDDNFGKSIRMSDGGYLLCGTSNSPAGPMKTSGNAGLWIIKVNSSFQKVWDKLETPPSVTSAERLSLVGVQENAAGNISILYRYFPGSETYYFLAVYSSSGTLIFQQLLASYSLNNTEQININDFLILNDDSYIIVGSRIITLASGFEKRRFIIKKNVAGQDVWRKEDNDDIHRELLKVIQLKNGRFLVAGKKLGTPIKSYCALYDGQGNELLQPREINSQDVPSIATLSQTSDGGFMAGYISPSQAGGDKSENSKGTFDYWIIKFDEGLKIVWDKTIGGSGEDFLSTVITMPDGSSLLGGYSNSNVSFDKSEASRGYYDFWVVKIDYLGRKVWDKTLGGSEWDIARSITTAGDDIFTIWGQSSSLAGGDKTDIKGGADYWGIHISAPSKAAIFTSNTTLCNGEATILEASNCPGKILWSTGAIGNSIIVNPQYTTTYTANCISRFGPVSCPSDPVTITVCQPGSQSTFGYTKGNFSATDGGAAVYSIPIVIPPGSSGVKPELGITYNSQGGNGLLGVGWNLNGLHAISRVTKTRAQDEAFDITRNSAIGISLSKEDRFSFNGSRLVLAPDFIEQNEILNGNYGRKGTEYITEQNQFTKVIIPDTLANGAPRYFIAYTKDGLIMEFGNTLDSRIDANDVNSTPISWLVNKISDRNGNYIKYTYSKEVSGVKGVSFPYGKINTYPIRIEYTANDAVPLSAYNRIEFEYIPRTDKQWNFVKGAYIGGGDKLISKIRVFGNNTEVRRYELTYTFGKFTANSLLYQIRECADTLCHEPTRFDWLNEEKYQFELTYKDYNTKNGPFPADAYTDINKIRLFGDWDGDGTTDLFLIDKKTGVYNYYLNRYPNSIPNGYNNFSEFPINIFSLPLKIEFRTADFNADGKTDILWWEPQTGNAYIIYSGYWDGNLHFLVKYSQSFIPPNNGYNDANLYRNLFHEREIQIVDWNHDGITDIVSTIKNGKYYNKGFDVWMQTQKPVYSTNPNIGEVIMNVQPISIPTPANSQDYNRLQFADFNNDGLSDVCVLDTATGNISIFKMLSVKTANKVFDSDSAKYRIQDPTYGIAFETNPKRFNWSPAQNKFIPYDGQITNFYGRSFFVIDANGDDLPDIAVKTSDVSYQFQLSTGDFGLFEDVYNLTPAEVPLGDDIGAELVDFNNDGNLDLLTYSRSSLYRGSSVRLSSFDNSTFTLSAPLSISLLNDASVSFFFGSYSKTNLNELLFYKVVGTALTNRIYTNKLEKSDLIGTINEGSGQEIQITYKTLKDPSVYTRSGSSFKYPLFEFVIPIPVVASVRNKDGIGGFYYTDYQYEGAFSHSAGRGFRGFTKVITKDRQRELYTVKYYTIDPNRWWLSEQPSKTETRLQDPINGKLLSLYEATTEAIPYTRSASFAPLASFIKTRGYFSYGKRSTTVTKDFNTDAQIEYTQTRVTHDLYGNARTVVVEHSGNIRDSTVNQYTDNNAVWLLGRLTRSTTYRLTPGKPIQARTHAYEYNPVTGQLTREITDPDSSIQIKTEIIYSHDQTGNIIQVERKAWNGNQLESRITQTVFDSQKRFKLSTANSLGHQASSTYHPASGSTLTTTNINGLTTLYEYDAFQRLVKATSATGEETVIKIQRAGSSWNSPVNAKFVIYKKQGSDPAVVEHYDLLNRLIKIDNVNFNGQTVSYTVSFNNRGEKITETGPGVNKVYYYDLMSRVVRSTNYGEDNTYEYIGTQVAVTDIKGRKRIVEKNTRGQLLNGRFQSSNGSIADQTVAYEYDARGNPTRITGNTDGFEIKSYFDTRGNQIQMDDPVMGKYRYEYNGFGELTKQIDPKGNIVQFEYDKLGRRTKRTEPEGITTYLYDTGNKAKGKLTGVNGFDNVGLSYSYDNFGRLSGESKTINGVNYVSSYLYRADNRIDRITYPSGLVVKHEYNAQNYHYIVRRISDGKVLWRAKTTNSVDNILTEDVYEKGSGQNAVLRHSYSYDADLNHLTLSQTFLPTDNSIPRIQRGISYDNIFNITAISESIYSSVGQLLRTGATGYGYDDLERLTSITPNLSFPQKSLSENTAVTLTYDLFGNIKTKSDVGVYNYDPNALGGPRYLSSVTPYNSAVCIPSFKVSTDYTSFNKVNRIANDSAYALIYYGPDHARVMQKMFVNNTLIKTKIYVNSLYEVEISGGQTKEISYIRSGSGVIGVETKTGANRSVQLWVKDHMNNLVAVVDTNGNVLEHLRYDVWGRRMNADMPGAAIETAVYRSDRGFTKHEHLDLFQLINMNGRMYDPVLGRFLSPDPFIQSPLDLQAFNRYAYVRNNPLIFIDPSGYSWFSDRYHEAKNALTDIGGGIGDVINGRQGVGGFLNDVANNPLARFLPGGEIFISYQNAKVFAKVMDSKYMPSAIRDNWRAPVTIAVSVAVGAVVTAYTGGNAQAGAAASGFTSGFLGSTWSGGSFTDAMEAGAKQAAISAATSLLTGGVNEVARVSGNGVLETGIRIVGYALVQGTMAEVQGGNFSDGAKMGALSGATSNIVSDYGPGGYSFESVTIRATMSAALGGTISAVNGGKFANGAMSSGFSELGNTYQSYYKLQQDPDYQEAQRIKAAFDKVDIRNGQEVAVHPILVIGAMYFGWQIASPALYKAYDYIKKEWNTPAPNATPTPTATPRW